MDVNDNVPEWAMKPFPFLAVVSPQATEGTEVYKLLAVDADEGINGTVEYFLLEGKFKPLFCVCIKLQYCDIFVFSLLVEKLPFLLKKSLQVFGVEGEKGKLVVSIWTDWSVWKLILFAKLGS